MSFYHYLHFFSRRLQMLNQIREEAAAAVAVAAAGAVAKVAAAAAGAVERESAAHRLA